MRGAQEKMPAPMSHGATHARPQTGHTVCMHLHLHVELRGVTPPVTRDIALPADATLTGLHHVLQAAFGWEDRHLHRFAAADGRGYADFSDGGDISERGIGVRELLAQPGDTLEYTYDFGDQWVHRVVLVGTADNTTAADAARLLALEGLAPVEDCGSPSGWEELRAAAAAAVGDAPLTDVQAELVDHYFGGSAAQAESFLALPSPEYEQALAARVAAANPMAEPSSEPRPELSAEAALGQLHGMLADMDTDAMTIDELNSVVTDFFGSAGGGPGLGGLFGGAWDGADGDDDDADEYFDDTRTIATNGAAVHRAVERGSLVDALDAATTNGPFYRMLSEFQTMEPLEFAPADAARLGAAVQGVVALVPRVLAKTPGFMSVSPTQAARIVDALGVTGLDSNRVEALADAVVYYLGHAGYLDWTATGMIPTEHGAELLTLSPEEAGYHVTRRLPTGQADHFVLQCAVMLDILVGTRATRALAQERGTTATEMHKEFLHLLAEDVWPSEDPDYAEEDIWEDFQYAHTVISTLGLGTPHAFVPGEIVFKPAVKAFLYRCLTQADPQWVLPVSEVGTRD